MSVGRIPQFVAWSKEGPTFQADLRGLIFTDGICGPLSSAMAERAVLFGANLLPVDPGDDLEWENSEVGWNLKAIPARKDTSVNMERLIVLDPDALPRDLSHELLAILKGYDLRSGKRK